ncbi:MAG: 1-acyl-sn-glycerol-3-phosphate acyltransferase [Desulfobacteraceae bacterium]|jgi:glycerol-3-phosphate O-acyltransferase
MTNPKTGGIGRWRAKRREWIERLLKGTYDHFLFFLPAKRGLVPWLLERIFNGIVLSKEQQEVLHKLPSDAILIYTIKFKSHFEYLFYHTRYRQEKLPVPELGLGYREWLLQPLSRILRSLLAHTDWFFSHWRRLNPYNSGYLAKELTSGRTALMPLVEKRDFYRRFVKAKTDPLRFLIELQKTTPRPIYIVPHMMFFSKRSASGTLKLWDMLLGTKQKPGLLRRLLILLRQPGKVFVEISQPLNLKQFILDNSSSNLEYQALKLRHQLLWQHNRHRQSITGPVVKSHEEIKESILANDRLRKFMAQHAASRKEPLHTVRKQADGFLDEIAAKYSFSFISFISGPVGWIFNTMYDGTVVDTDGLQKVKAKSQKGPLVLVPCHKSHVDYLILSLVLFQHNMPCPHIAAGKNLSFWPMGPIFRAGGAFFLRRTFRGAVLYAKVFSEYIHKLLEDGFNLELFIEGGRSRTGKLLMPKLGFLSILLNAYKNNACDDMIFVPVFIGYDQIIEEHAYLHEIEGGKKEPENLSQVLKAHRFLKQRYGKIYINFHEPISLKEILSDYDTSLQEMPQKTQNALCRNLGWRLINAIDEASVVTPHALVAAAILNCPDKRFTEKEIFQIIDSYIHLLFSQNAKLTDTLLMDHQRACEQALENYLNRKLIEQPGGEKNMPAGLGQFRVPSGKRMQLEYYKNNGIAYFVPAAITALTILEKDAFQFSAADLHDRHRFLQDFFKYEFAYDIDKTAETLVRKVIKSFIDDAILMPHQSLPDTYQITSSGLRKLKLFARFLKTYFESYLAVLHFFKQTPRNKARTKDRLKKIQAIGTTMMKNQEIELSESLSKINFQNGISFFTTHGVKGQEDMEALEDHEKTIRNYLHII